MCHNSILESEQIDKCIENGMPTKIIKTLKYTMRKRAAESVVHGNMDDNMQTDVDTRIKNNIAVKEPSSSRMKCPFAHGLLKPSISPPDSPFVSLVGNDDLQIPNVYGVRKANGLNNINTTSTASFDDATGITDLGGHDEMSVKDNDIYNDDILAKGTQFTRKLTFHKQQAIKRLQQSQTYTLLTKTTQPAHFLAICILSLVLLTIWPELIVGTSGSTQQLHEHVSPTKTDHRVYSVPKKNYTLALIAYLGAFSMHFGAQIWMTFVSGLSLYFSLPRHMFGQCQQILFPKYFAMNGTLSIIMLIIFVKYFINSWTKPQCIQLGALSLTGAIEVIVRLYLAPPLLYLMHEKYKIEGTIGSGKEVGSLVQGDLIQCPHYQRIHKAFRRIHMIVAIGNLITMAASCLHLYYIAGQIHISI